MSASTPRSVVCAYCGKPIDLTDITPDEWQTLAHVCGGGVMFWIEEPLIAKWSEGADELLWRWEAVCVECGYGWVSVTDNNGLTADALTNLAEWAQSHVCGVAS